MKTAEEMFFDAGFKKKTETALAVSHTKTFGWNMKTVTTNKRNLCTAYMVGCNHAPMPKNVLLATAKLLEEMEAAGD